MITTSTGNAAKQHVDCLANMAGGGEGARTYYGWLQAFGIEVPWGPLPADVEWMPLKACYANAYRLADSNPSRYVYCEGFAAAIIVCAHAWCLDLDTGKVVDPTWAPFEKEADPDLTYFGIPFELAFVRRTIAQSRAYGLAYGNHEVAENWLDSRIDLSEVVHQGAVALSQKAT